MGLKLLSLLLVQCCVFLVLSFGSVRGDDSEVAVKLLKTPREFSNKNSATFAFQVVMVENGNICTNCSTNCKLDDGMFSACKYGNVTYKRLIDGKHTFKVCANDSPGVACRSYNWTIDTVKPTAYITASSQFTSGSQVDVNISFSEPCIGGGGFTCSSKDSCNLLVYGDGEVMPNTLRILEPSLKYSVIVGISERVRYGRLIVVMDKNFCTDSANNQFTRTENSSLFIHFDRRSVFVDVRSHVPEKLLQINSETRTVMATNNNNNLKLYLYFTEPVMNSSAEILSSLNTSQGSLVPISGDNLGNRRFGYQLTDVTDWAVVTVSLHSDLIISRQGTPIAPVSPVTFLYDSQRPTVRLSTTCTMRTKEKSIYILIRFLKPVFGFNSSHVSVSGGYLQNFDEMSRSSYRVQIKADSDVISVYIPENITTDVSGNGNKPSNTLQVRHYSVPVESLVISFFATATFALTALIAGFLTISTTGLLSVGAFTRPSSIFCLDPARNLFRILSHIQVFALSRWLAVSLPVEYYEFARGLQWSIPYFTLPWEKGDYRGVMVASSSPKDRLVRISDISLEDLQPRSANVDPSGKAFGLPLTPVEYTSYFESQNILPEAEYILDPQNSHGWRDFRRSMFWLSIVAVGLILLHALLLLILKIRKHNKKEKQSYGALILPRFEIFLLLLALPCLCEAASAVLKGGTSSGTIVGVLIFSFVAFMLLFLLLFLSFGITLGKLLQYKEIHQVGQKFHWYQELVRVTLGPGKRGQWTWKNQANSIYLTILGPLFEDLRGPPKYMLSQITGSSSNKSSNDRIIASDDENEDAEAPFIQKLFGILRIYYTLIECVKRVSLGSLAGGYSQTWTSRKPTVILLCITSFQLFFMVLKKPFIKKKVQLVEIISVASEVAIFAFCIVILERDFSPQEERNLGIAMISIFLFAFWAQMMNEWYALYMQIKLLDPVTNSFFQGLETGLIGFFVFFLPLKWFERRFPINNSVETVNASSAAAERIRRSSASRNSGETKPWLRQIRELARSSFGREGSVVTNHDPSTSKTRWSGFWKNKRSGSSSASTSMDYKAKPRGLYKELEEIFASK